MIFLHLQVGDGHPQVLQLILTVGQTQGLAEIDHHFPLGHARRRTRPRLLHGLVPALVRGCSIEGLQISDAGGKEGSDRLPLPFPDPPKSFRQRAGSVGDVRLQQGQGLPELPDLPGTFGIAAGDAKSGHGGGNQDQNGSDQLQHGERTISSRSTRRKDRSNTPSTVPGPRRRLKSTYRPNAPSRARAESVGLRHTSSRVRPWAVVNTCTPAWTASYTASPSSLRPISSTTRMSGDMERIIIIIPSAFGHPSNTSVRGPTSCWGIPCTHPASSERSSTIPTFRGERPLSPVLTIRARSRSKVVLPHCGGETMCTSATRTS